MDVASFVVLCSCIAQATGDRYGGYSGPSNYTPTPNAPTTPYTPPSAMAPNHGPPPSEPIYTAAADKKKSTPPPATMNPTSPSSGLVGTPIPRNVAPSGAVADDSTTPPSTSEKTAAGELIREAVVVPQSLSVAGRGTTLYETLASAGDSRRQLDAARGYWKLAAELAEYHYAWQQTQFLEHLQKVTSGRNGESSATAAEIAARLAATRAEQREAELGLLDAQVRLSEISSISGASGRPLPVDLPHVGPYHTRFEHVYSGRAAAPRAHALNRSLPLRKDVVDMRADGVWAAQDAYEAAFEAYQKGQLPIEEVLTALDDFRLRRSEFLTAVRQYNDEIAEYAVLSAPWGVGPDALVRMLIKNPSRPAALGVGAAFDEDGGVVAASFDEPNGAFEPVPDPVSATTAAPSLPAAANGDSSPAIVIPSSAVVPRNPPPSIASSASATLTPPTNNPPAPFTPPSDAAPLMPYPSEGSSSPTTVSPPAMMMPTSPNAPPPSRLAPTLAPPIAPSSSPSSTPYGGSSNPLRGKPTLAPPQVPASDAFQTPQYKVNKIPLTGDGEAPGGNALMPANDPAYDFSAASPPLDSAVEPVGYFAQLTSLPPDRRAQDLVETLYSTAQHDAQLRQVTLSDCLAKVGAAEQPRVVAAYWHASEQAARAVAFAKTVERLDALGNAVLRMSDSPAKTSAMLRVRSGRLAAGADRKSALARLEIYRAELTDAVHESLTSTWLTPITVPHGGAYKTKIDALPASLSNSPGLRRMADRIDVLHDTIVLRAEAVVQGDAAVDGVLDDFSRGRATAHMVVADVARQSAETDALLSATTRYNLTIAGYALAVLPGDAPRETLVGAMVLDRTAVASRP